MLPLRMEMQSLVQLAGAISGPTSVTEISAGESGKSGAVWSNWLWSDCNWPHLPALPSKTGGKEETSQDMKRDKGVGKEAEKETREEEKEERKREGERKKQKSNRKKMMQRRKKLRWLVRRTR